MASDKVRKGKGSSLYMLHFVTSVSYSKAALVGCDRCCLPHSRAEADTGTSGRAQVKVRGDLFDRWRSRPAQARRYLHALQPSHVGHQTCGGRFCHQVVVVAHQAIRLHLPAGFLARLGQWSLGNPAAPHHDRDQLPEAEETSGRLNPPLHPTPDGALSSAFTIHRP